MKTLFSGLFILLFLLAVGMMSTYNEKFEIVSNAFVSFLLLTFVGSLTYKALYNYFKGLKKEEKRFSSFFVENTWGDIFKSLGLTIFGVLFPIYHLYYGVKSCSLVFNLTEGFLFFVFFVFWCIMIVLLIQVDNYRSLVRYYQKKKVMDIRNIKDYLLIGLIYFGYPFAQVILFYLLVE